MLTKIAVTSLTVAGVAAIALSGSEPARAALLYDNIGAPSVGASARDISNFAIADDFTLAQAFNLTNFTFWAFGVSADSDVSNNIGWAIFNNNAGAVGSLIASGTDTSVSKTDTGLNSNLGTNILKVDGDFGGTISLTAGTYWISFRDGAWGSSNDGTTAGWTDVSGLTIGNPVRFDANEVNPTFPNTLTTSLHFQLFNNSAPPAATPEPGMIFGLLAAGAAGALVRGRRG